MDLFAFVAEDDSLYVIPTSSIPLTEPSLIGFRRVLKSLGAELPDGLYFLSEATTALTVQGSSWEEHNVDPDAAVRVLVKLYHQGRLTQGFQAELTSPLHRVAVHISLDPDGEFLINTSGGMSRLSAQDVAVIRDEVRQAILQGSQ